MTARGTTRLLSALAMLMLLPGLTATPAAARHYPLILGSRPGISSSNFGVPVGKVPFVPLWADMIARWHSSKACSPIRKPGVPCTTAGWKEALARGRGLKGMDLLRAVNDAFNSALYPYVHEVGNLDYWETPYQFLEMSGDCEDYAIAKYMALKELGVPEEDMMILAVSMKNKKTDNGHAVLLVFLGDQGWVLDILNAHVLDQTLVKETYLPLMAINAQFWMYLHNVT